MTYRLICFINEAFVSERICSLSCESEVLRQRELPAHYFVLLDSWVAFL